MIKPYFNLSFALKATLIQFVLGQLVYGIAPKSNEFSFEGLNFA